MPKPKTVQSKSWCFTLNNYTDDEQAAVRALDTVYTVFGREIGESGTPHLQGFLRFKKKRTMSKLRKALPRAHWIHEVKGTAAENRTYCTKDGDFEEIGECPKSPGEGEKDRWRVAYIAAQEGRLDDIPYDIRWKYDATCYRIRSRVKKKIPNADDVTGIWLYGVAGSGKSRYAQQTYPDAYRKGTNKWWCDYVDEDDVIIEDMDPFHKYLGRDFKIWADRYPFPAEFKGGKMDIRPKRIIVTSQYSIDQIWPDVETRNALHRRFTCIRFPGPLRPPPETQFPKEIPANDAQTYENRILLPPNIQEAESLPSEETLAPLNHL